MLRFLMRYLMHNERLITKLSESRPMRRAAQFVVYIFTRANPGNRLPDNPREFISQLKDIANKHLGEFKNGIQNKKK